MGEGAVCRKEVEGNLGVTRRRLSGVRWHQLRLHALTRATSGVRTSRRRWNIRFGVRDHVVESALGMKAKLNGVQLEASIVGRSGMDLHKGGDREDVVYRGDVLGQTERPVRGFVGHGVFICRGPRCRPMACGGFAASEAGDDAAEIDGGSCGTRTGQSSVQVAHKYALELRG